MKAIYRFNKYQTLNARIKARFIRWLWLLNPRHSFCVWCAYDLYNYKGDCLIMGAIKHNTPPRKDDPTTLKVFWKPVSESLPGSDSMPSCLR